MVGVTVTEVDEAVCCVDMIFVGVFVPGDKEGLETVAAGTPTHRNDVHIEWDNVV